MPFVFIGNLGIAIPIICGSIPKLDWKLAPEAAERGRGKTRQEIGTAILLGRLSSARLPPPKSVKLSLAYARYRAHADAEAVSEARRYR
jgi:hypothetical protein